MMNNSNRISVEEGLALYELPLGDLAQRADNIKRSKFGDKITFVKNYYLNFTNICRYACKYCGFRRSPRSKDAYTLEIDEVLRRLAAAPENLSEVWFSNGLNDRIPYSYYLDLLREVKSLLPQAQIKAFTAVEIDFISKKFSKSWAEVLDDFFAAGLDRIPGGGAEIFAEDVREKVDIKIRSEDYLAIHALCHARDRPTSMTMLFGHVESRRDRLEHMAKIRDFQDQSHGVQAFIPLAFQAHNNPLAKSGVKGPSPVESLKTLAISRIFLDNVSHIQAFWIDLGDVLTQASLHFGVDDINGTMIEENIAHASGATSATYESTASLQNWISSAGLSAVERDCAFQVKVNA